MKTFVEIGCSDFNNLENFLDYGWRGFLLSQFQNILILYLQK